MPEEIEDHEEDIPDGPAAVTVFPWLRCNLGAHALAPLTGTDQAALRAAVHIIELHQLTGAPSLHRALHACVRQMQRECRWFAYHAIAHVGEWGDRSILWGLADLWSHCDFRPETVRRCKYEPNPKPRPVA